MILVETHVGRLFETRLVSPLSPQELVDCVVARTQVLAHILQTHPRYVSCVDIRHTRILSAAQAQSFIEILRANNANLERAAFLLSPKTLSLQVRRVLYEAQNQNRRHFDEVNELYVWLGEVLTEAELVRLKEFIKEGER